MYCPSVEEQNGNCDSNQSIGCAVQQITIEQPDQDVQK